MVWNVQKRKKCVASPTVTCLFDEALRIVKRIEIGATDASDVTETLCAIAPAQAEADDKAGAKMTLTDAMHVAERIDDARESDYGFSEIAAVQIKAGDIVEATQTVERIKSPSVLSQIAAVQAEAGDIVWATQTAEESRTRASVLQL